MAVPSRFFSFSPQHELIHRHDARESGKGDWFIGVDMYATIASPMQRLETRCDGWLSEQHVFPD